jgi:hypothetical protein
MTESAAAIAKALGGHRAAGGWLVRCPCPGHGNGKGDRNPSLSIADGEQRLLVKCFAGCTAEEVLDALRQRGLLEADRPTSAYRPPPPTPGPASEPAHEPDPIALKIWKTARPIAGTLTETYLTEHRGLLPPFPPTLRSSHVHYPRAGLLLPAMVAAVQAPDRRVVAVQATFLRDRDGAKAPVSDPRRTTGALGAGAVRLAAAGPVLGLAEGVEDALSAISLTNVPTWACIGAGRMHVVTIPDEVRELHVFVDDDEPGRAAAERTTSRHTAEGRRVVLRLPPDGFKDWNDVAMEGALA